MNPRLLIRKVPESNQRENWEGFAVFVQAPLAGGSEPTWLEKRLTPPEAANGDIAMTMVFGQEWAKANGYTLPKGWHGGEDGVTARLESAPRQNIR